MAYLLAGVGTAGNAILKSVLSYKEVKRDKPVVLKLGEDAGNRIDRELTRASGTDFGLVFSELNDSDVSHRVAGQLHEHGIKQLFIGVLPARRRQKSENIISAFYALEKLKEYVNTFILVDNQRIAHLPNFEEYIPQYNRYIASCIVDILAGLRGGESIEFGRLLALLSFDDEPGYVALSRSSELTKDLPGYILPFIMPKPLDLRTLVRISLEKLSIADAPVSSEKCVTFLRVPAYYIDTEHLDKDLVVDFMHMYARECYVVVCSTGRNIAAITNLFAYRFEQLKRLRELRGLAHEGL